MAKRGDTGKKVSRWFEIFDKQLKGKNVSKRRKRKILAEAKTTRKVLI